MIVKLEHLMHNMVKTTTEIPLIIKHKQLEKY